MKLVLMTCLVILLAGCDLVLLSDRTPISPEQMYKMKKECETWGFDAREVYRAAEESRRGNNDVVVSVTCLFKRGQ